MSKKDDTTQLRLTELIGSHTEKLRWERLPEEEKEKIRREKKAEKDRVLADKKRAAQRNNLRKRKKEAAERRKRIEKRRTAIIKKIQSALKHIESADPNYLHVEEKAHPFFCAILSIGSGIRNVEKKVLEFHEFGEDGFEEQPDCFTPCKGSHSEISETDQLVWCPVCRVPFIVEIDLPFGSDLAIPRHKWRHARTQFQITVGRSGASIKPGESFDSFDALHKYLRGNFLTKVAELVAEAKLSYEEHKDWEYEVALLG